MFEIFIAFFGGLYYLSVILGGKLRASASRAERNYDEKCFKNIVAELNTSFRVGDMIWADKDERFEGIIQTIEPDFTYALGENWRERYARSIEMSAWSRNSLSRAITDGRGDPMWVAEQIILAKQGKIDLGEMMHQIQGSPQMQEVQLRTFEIIEREIQKIYPNCKIVISKRNPNSASDGGWIKWKFD